MGEIYSENLVNKELAKAIGEYFNRASSNLSYAKGYKGTVVSGSNGSYKIQINGVEHSLKTDYMLNPGDFVTVLSLQNQQNDYVLIPSAKQIMNLIGGT